MDPRLLLAYGDQWRYYQAFFGEFAQSHPKIARRLGAQAGAIADPYIGRALQAAAFITAGTSLAIEDAWPRVAQDLLRHVYPNYLSPTPSMAVARVFPSMTNGRLVAGHVIPRGTVFTSGVPEGEKTACRFSTSQDVVLWPIEVALATLTRVPPDIPGLSHYMPPGIPAQAALRLTLRTTDGSPVSSLNGLDRLPVYLSGADEALASRLFELIHTGAHATIMGRPGDFMQGRLYAVTQDAVVHEGLAPDQSVLRPVSPGLHGHALLHEAMACPARFWFFTLTGLAQALALFDVPEIEIVILLAHSAHELEARVDADQFALFCTPVANLFPRRIDALAVPADGGEVALVPDEDAPNDYEAAFIGRVWGQANLESERIEIYPLQDALVNDESETAHYYTTRHELHEDTARLRRYGTLSPFTQTRQFLSLPRPPGAPDAAPCVPLRYLSLDAWLTNRDLPRLLRCDGNTDLMPHKSTPVQSIGLIRTPSRPRAPLAQGALAWELVEHLHLNWYLFDGRVPDRAPGEGLKRRLRPFIAPEAIDLRRQVESLVGVTSRPVNAVVGRAGGAIPVRRCVEITLTFDERGFAGASPYTLGLVLNRYLARYVSTQSFTITVLRTVQRGESAAWDASLCAAARPLGDHDGRTCHPDALRRGLHADDVSAAARPLVGHSP
jgi:type VI secretion system protein ImpG